MHFRLIDRILELRPGEEIVAIKALSQAEDYLQDHFPLFPVMPGVLMLEAMYQASAWLVRATDNFAHSQVLLTEAKNIRYADFVRPGQVLEVTSTIQKRDGNQTMLRVQGRVDQRTAVGARLVLTSSNLCDDQTAQQPPPHTLTQPEREAWGTDEYCRQQLMTEFEQLTRTQTIPTSS